MFCPNCGQDCGTAKFCSECGQNLDRTSDKTFEACKKAMRESGQAYCPVCLSTSVTVLERKNRYIHSPFGAMFWWIREGINHRSEKKDGMECVCMKCDHRWYTKRQAMREQHARKTSELWKMYPISRESYIVLNDFGITMGHYGKLEYHTPYEEIVAVEHRKGIGPLNGRLSIRNRENRRRKFPNTFEKAKQDELTVFYNAFWEKDIETIYVALKQIVEANKNAGMF